jgi:hypothetical protein
MSCGKTASEYVVGCNRVKVLGPICKERLGWVSAKFRPARPCELTSSALEPEQVLLCKRTEKTSGIANRNTIMVIRDLGQIRLNSRMR